MSDEDKKAREITPEEAAEILSDFPDADEVSLEELIEDVSGVTCCDYHQLVCRIVGNVLRGIHLHPNLNVRVLDLGGGQSAVRIAILKDEEDADLRGITGLNTDLN